MIPTFSMDLTTVLAPFAWCAVGFVMIGLGAIIVNVIRGERTQSSALHATEDRDGQRRAA